MGVKKLTPTLIVDDMDQAIAYYTETLGFAVLSAMPGGAARRPAVGDRGRVSLPGGVPGGGFLNVLRSTCYVCPACQPQ